MEQKEKKRIWGKGNTKDNLINVKINPFLGGCFYLSYPFQRPWVTNTHSYQHD